MSKDRPSPVKMPDKPIPELKEQKKNVKFVPVDIMLNELLSDGERHKATDVYEAIREFRDDQLISVNACQGHIVRLRQRMKVLEPENLVVTERLGYVIFYRKCRHLKMQ